MNLVVTKRTDCTRNSVKKESAAVGLHIYKNHTNFPQIIFFLRYYTV